MSVFHPVSLDRRETTRQTVSRTHVHEPVLITEHEVLFATAAAAASPARHNVIAMMSHAVSSAAGHWRAWRTRPYYPSRLPYLEESLMSREMYRL